MNLLRAAGAAAGAAITLFSGVAVPAHADLAGVSVGPSTAVRTPAPGCTPSATFSSLRAQLGESVVGSGLECARYTEAGDQVQATTKGQFVWRRADNWSGFTNGSRTWVLVPTGVASRSNDQRFEWESDYGAPGTVPYAPPAPPPAPAEPAPLVPGTQLGVPVSGQTLTLTVQAFEWGEPRFDGTRWAKATVKVEPGTIRRGRFDYWDFHLRSPEGVEYQASALGPARPGGLRDGTLAAGQFVVGDLWFELPANGGGYELHFYPQGHRQLDLAISRWIGGAV